MVVLVVLIFLITIMIIPKTITKSEGRYFQLYWDYPIPDNLPHPNYRWSFTDKPLSPSQQMGAGGRGYLCFDLFNNKDIEELKKYEGIPLDIINRCVEINSRYEKVSGY